VRRARGLDASTAMRIIPSVPVLETARRRTGPSSSHEPAIPSAARRAHPISQVRVVTARDHVRETRSGGQPRLVELHEELAREAQPLVDLEAAVEIRIV